MLALIDAGIKVERYVAYEIDKYAIQTSSHNFPMIEHCGDVFEAEFTEYCDFDFLIGGSPCTYWSIAQKNNRETEASGMGWELFSQYVRALKEARPRYFIYENNKSIANAIRQSITETFGFEPICINSALVSAQNRQRLYWVGKRNLDGTYSRVYVEQPTDLGIILRDVLDYEPVNFTADGKSQALKAQYHKNSVANFVNGSGHYPASGVAEPLRVGTWPNDAKNQAHDSQQYRIYSTDGKGVTLCGNGGGLGAKTGLYAVPVESQTVLKAIPKIADKYGFVPEMFNSYNTAKNTDKTLTLSTGLMVTSSCAVNRFEEINGYAIPCEWDVDCRPTKAISTADSKVYPVYEVKGGQITIKDKQYHIKLADGFYIIRKLTVSECKRLQTVPEWYEFPVSDTQAYKMLGNGWTVRVITHLILATQEVCS